MKENCEKWIALILFLLVLAIINVFFNGGYICIDKATMAVIFIGILISIVMMVVPFIYWVIKRKKMDMHKGKILCLLNSLIITALVVIPNLIDILNPTTSGVVMSIDPKEISKDVMLSFICFGFIYYFINTILFVECKLPKGKSKEKTEDKKEKTEDKKEKTKVKKDDTKKVVSKKK